MSCCHPFKAFKTGYKTENGKDDLIIAFDDVFCDRLSLDSVKKKVKLSQVPHVVENGHIYLTDPVKVPCGQCVGCRSQRAREWKIRNCLELLDHKEAYFLTLTYDDWHLPVMKKDFIKRDFQLFIKRLRKLGDYRYFACFELGEKTHRPHFHCLLYGHLEGFKPCGVRMYNCPILDECWKNGFVTIEDVCPGNIAYVSGYVEKKWKMDTQEWSVPPFLLMSTRPAIGRSYFEKRKKSFELDPKVYGVFSDFRRGSSAPLPKYYRKQLENEPWYEDFKEASRLAGESMERVLLVTYRMEHPESLRFAVHSSLENKLSKVRKETL